MQGMLLLTSIMPVVKEIGDGADDIKDGLEDIDIGKVADTTEYRELLRESKNIAARSRAILYELVDSVKHGR